MWRIWLLSEIKGTIICKPCPDKQADYRKDMCLWVTILSEWTAVLVWIICLLTDNLKNCLAIKRGHPDTEGNAHSITLSQQLLAISCQMQGKFCAISAQLRLTSYFFSSGTEPFANTGKYTSAWFPYSMSNSEYHSGWANHFRVWKHCEANLWPSRGSMFTVCC